jgi:hypothetical protein
MKNRFLSFFLLIICATACSKDETSSKNQIGAWTGVELQTVTINGSITSEITIDFTLDLNESGDGIFNNTFGSDKEVHWVLDEQENEIFLIREFTSGGEELFTTTRFNIEKNTDSEQVWTNTNSYVNANNETEERFITWTLTK